MIFIYLSIPLFLLFYFTLRGFARLDLKIPLFTVSFLCTLITLFIYKELGGEETYSLVNDKEILKRFIADESENKETDAIEVGRIIFEISNKKGVQAGEIYLLAKRLKAVPYPPFPLTVAPSGCAKALAISIPCELVLLISS